MTRPKTNPIAPAVASDVENVTYYGSYPKLAISTTGDRVYSFTNSYASIGGTVYDPVQVASTFVRHSSTGTLKSVSQVINFNQVHGVAAGGSGKVYGTGRFDGTATFGGTSSLTAAGKGDAYIWQIP